MKTPSKRVRYNSTMFRSLGLALLLTASSVFAQTLPTKPTDTDNAELTLLFKEDQRVRQPKPLGPDEPKITRNDGDRLALVKEMIAHDQVHTTADELHAAIVLQHASASADYLLAHTLAVLCAAGGDKTCLWLSSASLDRYLMSMQQPQI
jgi:hypothetical protein